MKWPLKYNSLFKEMTNPLHLAIAYSKVEVISNLLDRGADVNAIEVEGITPLHVAIKREKINILRLLLKAGANVNSTDHKYTPLHLAIYSKKVNILKLLLEADGVDVEEKGKYDCTPLQLAAESDDVGLLKLLINARADVNAAEKSTESPLGKAVKQGKISNVKFLLDSGADVNPKGISDFTPLHYAIFTHPNSKILKLLLKNGADPYPKSIILNSPLNLILISSTDDYLNERKECLKLLLEYTDVNLIEVARYEPEKNGRNILRNLLLNSDYRKNDYPKIILEHVAKLKALDYEIDSSLLDTISSNDDDNEYFMKCSRELEKAKETKPHNCWITFFDLLIEDELKIVKYAENQDLIQDLEKNAKNFPIYGSTIQKNMSKGINKRELWDTAASILSYNLPIFNSNHLIIGHILDNLKKNDWKNLCEKSL